MAGHATGMLNNSYVMVMRKEGGVVNFILDSNNIFPRLFKNSEEAIVCMVKEMIMDLDDIRECKFVKVVPGTSIDLSGIRERNSSETFDEYNEKNDIAVINSLGFKVVRRRNGEYI